MLGVLLVYDTHQLPTVMVQVSKYLHNANNKGNTNKYP